VVSF
jgi:hypothetical protein